MPRAIEGLWKGSLGRLSAIDVVRQQRGDLFRNHPPLTTGFEDWAAKRGRERSLPTCSGRAQPLALFARPKRWFEQGGGKDREHLFPWARFAGEPTAPAYAASKAGLNALSQSLAKALAPKGIYVFVCCTGVGCQRRESPSRWTDPAGTCGSTAGACCDFRTRWRRSLRFWCALDAPASLHWCNSRCKRGILPPLVAATRVDPRSRMACTSASGFLGGASPLCVAPPTSRNTSAMAADRPGLIVSASIAPDAGPL